MGRLIAATTLLSALAKLLVSHLFIDKIISLVVGVSVTPGQKGALLAVFSLQKTAKTAKR